MTKDYRLKCKFCNATFLKWKREKNGKKISGFETIRDHLAAYHEEEFEKMQKLLGPEE